MATRDVFLAQIGYQGAGVNPIRTFSDRGFIDTPSSGYSGLYPPALDQSLDVTRQAPIGPEAGTTVSASWGNITILNDQVAGGADVLGDLVVASALPGHAVKIVLGTQLYDAVNGIWNDVPLVSGGLVLFSGISNFAESDGKVVSISIRDNLAQLELPIQPYLYSGAGGVNGASANTGKPFPKTRGKVLNIAPVLMDPTNIVYQWTDNSGSVLAVYERGYAGFTFAGNYATYAALIAATVAAGQYATCTSAGYMRMGVQPVGALTIDATGDFPSPIGVTSSGTKPGTLALNLITQEYSSIGFTVQTGTFTQLDTNAPYPMGIYTADQPFTGVALLDQILSGAGASIGTDSFGRVAVFQITVPAGGFVTMTLDTTKILDTRPVDLPDSVAVPNWRRTVGYARNYTIETSDLSPLLTSAQVYFLGRDYDSGIAINSSNKTTYPTSPDAPRIATQILNAADAQALAYSLIQLWGAPRFLFDHDLPLEIGLPYLSGSTPIAPLEIGTTISLTYPVYPLESGKVGIVVGNVIDVKNRKFTIRVLY